MDIEIQKIDKIYKCLRSCETLEQFDSAFSMLFRYSENKKPTNESELIFINQVENYALIKKKEFSVL